MEATGLTFETNFGGKSQPGTNITILIKKRKARTAPHLSSSEEIFSFRAVKSGLYPDSTS